MHTRYFIIGDCGNWESYGACSKTCGGGVQVRTRTCPENSLHLKKQKKHCNTNLCPGQRMYCFSCECSVTYVVYTKVTMLPCSRRLVGKQQGEEKPRYEKGASLFILSFSPLFSSRSCLLNEAKQVMAM